MIEAFTKPLGSSGNFLNKISLKYSASTFVYSFQHGKPWDNPSGNLYAKLYRSGYDVFMKYPRI